MSSALTYLTFLPITFSPLEQRKQGLLGAGLCSKDRRCREQIREGESTVKTQRHTRKASPSFWDCLMRLHR